MKVQIWYWDKQGKGDGFDASANESKCYCSVQNIMSALAKTVQCLRYIGVLAFVSYMISVVKCYNGPEVGVFCEQNVIYLDFCDIHGLFSVSDESRVNGYGFCFTGSSWKIFWHLNSPFSVS